MTILFAGGGTGGHIFPNLAVVERLRELGLAFEPHFLISNRPLDAKLLHQHEVPYTVLPVGPLTFNPLRLPGWYSDYRRSVRRVVQVAQGRRAAALVATGGFVSGPAIAGAASVKISPRPGFARRSLPVLMVNLDAAPGKANRVMARKATHVMSVYPVTDWPHAQTIAMPLRRIAVGPEDKAAARKKLGMLDDRPGLLVCGGSQGADSINKAMIALTKDPQVATALSKWQVLHLSGDRDPQLVREAYKQANIPAAVLTFCDEMGLAWAACDLAISRAGANSVAEAWANACPTVFLPYPYHKDEHQRLNAQPLVDKGGALVVKDLIEPDANAKVLAPLLLELVRDETRRATARKIMLDSRPDDGAMAIARWVHDAVSE